MALSFYFDGTRCNSCKACVIACKDFKDLPAGTAFRRVIDFETGTYPTARCFHQSLACNHCESPACIAACPTGAMRKAADGTVVHDDGVCIGCQSCVSGCPYGAPVLREDLGIVQKCDACQQRRGAGLDPMCVAACPMRALDFGEREELEARYAGGDGVVSDLPYLPSSSETGPNLLIKPKKQAMEKEFRIVTL